MVSRLFHSQEVVSLVMPISFTTPQVDVQVQALKRVGVE